MTQQILTHTFENGLTLVAEPMDWLESAAFSLLVPAGCSHDPADRLGLANFCCDMAERGCGSRSSRQYVEDLELLGVESGSSVSNSHTSFSGAMPAASLHDALSIYADVARRPHLPSDQLEEGRLVCLQEVRALEDELAHQVILELRRRRYPSPYGRHSYGTMESVGAVTHDDVRNFVERHYGPRNAILSVAGNIQWDQLRDHVEAMFGDWTGEAHSITTVDAPSDRYCHINHESSQTHIGVVYPNVPFPHEDYFQSRGAVGVLSDGMSSRLFSEVREKRGLCYAVSASCHSLKDIGSVVCYAGTTTERAQETLDTVIAELVRLADGVEQDELDRLKAKIKSSLIMEQESSSSRSGAIARDWYYLNRVRTRDELGAIIDALTCDTINRYLADNPPSDFKVVTLGEQELEMPVAVS